MCTRSEERGGGKEGIVCCVICVVALREKREGRGIYGTITFYCGQRSISLIQLQEKTLFMSHFRAIYSIRSLFVLAMYKLQDDPVLPGVDSRCSFIRASISPQSPRGVNSRRQAGRLRPADSSHSCIRMGEIFTWNISSLMI